MGKYGPILKILMQGNTRIIFQKWAYHGQFRVNVPDLRQLEPHLG